MKLNKYRVALFLVIALVVAGSSLGATAASAAGQTKIAPTEAAPPHPFTIIDTPEGRLIDGSVAVFRFNGAETVIPLGTHKPYKTAQGRLPAGMGGGDYEVSVRQPGGTEFVVGMFKVLAPVVEPTVPTITPTSGVVNTAFTITDPQGRIQTGDLAVFYPEGGDPTVGRLAWDVTVSLDGKTLTGNVPSVFIGNQNMQNYVSVRPTLTSSSRFGDLAYFIESSTPTITPTSGASGLTFNITDPQGRMSLTDAVMFYRYGEDPNAGTPATNVTISADGTTLTGTVPYGLAEGVQHYVSVRQLHASLFGDLAFLVTF